MRFEYKISRKAEALAKEILKKGEGLHCERCGKEIVHPYEWKGQLLGKSCWKIEALPEIKAQEQIVSDAFAYERMLLADAYLEMLEKKPLGRIKSEFKLKFFASLIEQIKEKGFISRRQKEMLEGTGEWNGQWYDNGMLGKKDYDNLFQAKLDRLLVEPKDQMGFDGCDGCEHLMEDGNCAIAGEPCPRDKKEDGEENG